MSMESFLEWKHSQSDDGPIFKTTEHALIDTISGEPHEDTFGRLWLQGFLDHARCAATEILDHRDGECGPSAEQIDEARAVLSLIDSVERCTFADTPGYLPPDSFHDCRALARAGIRLGSAYERMVGRHAEPDAERGQTTIAGARKGGTKTSKKHKAPPQGWDKAVRDQMDRGDSYTKACKIVGKRQGVSSTFALMPRVVRLALWF